MVRHNHELRLRQMLDIESETEVDMAVKADNMEIDCANDVANNNGQPQMIPENLCNDDNIPSNNYTSVRGLQTFSGLSVGFCMGGELLSRNEEISYEHTQALERENASYGQHQEYTCREGWPQALMLGELRSREVKTIIDARNMDPT